MKLILLCLTFALLIQAPVGVQAPSLTVVAGATLFDGTAREPVRDALIVIDGVRIRQVAAAGAFVVPAGATVVDARGKFVIPGLADMHNHLQDGSLSFQHNLTLNLSKLLALGVTSVFDPSVGLKDFAALKAVSAAPASTYPHFFGTGPSVTVKGDVLGLLDGSVPPATAADARNVARTLKAAGVDAIKVQRDDLSWSGSQRLPIMDLEVLTALVSEAHDQRLKVFVHAPLLRYAKEALRAGVDGLLHGILDEPVDQEFLTLMKGRQAVYVPTMALYEDIADVAAWSRRLAPYWDQSGLQPAALYGPFTTPAGVKQFESIFSGAFTKAHLPTQRANVKTVFDAGIPVVMGTDTGFFGVLLGVSSHVELELLVEAGLKPVDAIRSATSQASRMIGREMELGTIEAGKLADLLILDANPLEDIRAVRRIHRVVKGGVVHDPAKLPR